MLLKGYDERGFVFFTNYGSRKGARARRQPAASAGLPLVPAAAPGARRRAGSSGSTGRRPRRTSPPGRAARSSGAWASPQSQVVAGRAELDAALRGRRPSGSPDGEPIPAPPHWGGFRVVPDDGGVLAGPAEPAARPAAATGCTGDRRDVDRRAAGAVTGDARGPTRPARFAAPARDRRPPAARTRRTGGCSSATRVVVLRLPVHRGRRTGAGVRPHPLVALGRPARPRRRCVPLIVFGLWGGAVADALDRRRLLLVSSALMWAATLGLLVQALLGRATARCCCWRWWRCSRPRSRSARRPAARSCPGWCRRGAGRGQHAELHRRSTPPRSSARWSPA